MRLRTALGEPLVLALMVCIGAFIKYSADIRTAEMLGKPTTFNQQVGSAVIVAIVVALLGYLLQVAFGRPLFEVITVQSKTVICNACFQMKQSDCQRLCDCGGTFEDFDLWKWISDTGTPQGDDTTRNTDAIEPRIISLRVSASGPAPGGLECVGLGIRRY